MFDDVSGVVEGDGGDAALGQYLAVVGCRQVLLDRGADLGVEDDAFFDAEFTKLQFAGQCRLHPPAGGGVLTGHLATHTGPMVELLLGRPALPRTLGGRAVEQIRGERVTRSVVPAIVPPSCSNL